MAADRALMKHFIMPIVKSKLESDFDQKFIEMLLKDKRLNN